MRLQLVLAQWFLMACEVRRVIEQTTIANNQLGPRDPLPQSITISCDPNPPLLPVGTAHSGGAGASSSGTASLTTSQTLASHNLFSELLGKRTAHTLDPSTSLLETFHPTRPENMANPKADKIEKIITRLQARIGEGQYYEAQQQTRVVAARYIKASNWNAAIEILYNVAQSLLKAGEGGSGGDLCVFLVDVYKQAELKPDGTSRGRLLTCLRLFPAGEPTRKKFVGEMIA